MTALSRKVKFRNFCKLRLSHCSAALFVLCLISLSGLQHVGGDNSQLYYIYPEWFISKEYLQSFITNNALGIDGFATQQIYQLPFFYFLYFVKNTIPNFVNLSSVLFALNLTLAYYFFGKSTALILKQGQNNINILVSSLFYSLSWYSYGTVYTHGLYAFFLASFLPIQAYVLLNDRYKTYIIGALTTLLYSVALFAVPWFAGSLLILSPLFAYLVVKQNALKRVAIYLFLLFLVHSFWIYPFVISIIYPSVGNVLGITDINSTMHIVHEVTRENNVIYPVMGLSMPRWVDGIDKWAFLLSGYSFFLIIINYSVQPRNSEFIYKVIFCTWIVSIIVYTISIDNIWTQIFDWIYSIPQFGMFRNNFDKFSLGCAYASSLLLAVALRRPNLQVKLLSAVIFVSLISNATFPLLNRPLWTTKDVNTRIDKLDNDYINALYFLKGREGKTLNLPLTMPGYIIVGTDIPNHYYIGTSPHLLITRREDYTNESSFRTSSVAEDIPTMLNKKNFDMVISLLNEYNIKNILVSKGVNDEIAQSYLFSRPPDYMNTIVDDMTERKSQFKKIFENKSFVIFDVISVKPILLSSIGGCAFIDSHLSINGFSSITIPIRYNSKFSLIDKYGYQNPLIALNEKNKFIEAVNSGSSPYDLKDSKICINEFNYQQLAGYLSIGTICLLLLLLIVL